MKIGILTYYGVHNHGAVLQANALRQVLLDKGHDCGFLEFERDYSNISEIQANKYKLGIGSIFFYAKYFLEKGIGNIFYNIQKKKTLDQFRKTNLPMIGDYKKFSGDLIVIGSDEVFSLEIGVNPFLYGNDLPTKHSFSYAGCFGPTTYEDVIGQKQENMIRKGLQKLEAVSVRDENSLDTVKKIANIDAKLVCDPVILYGYKKERGTFVPPERDYILVYSYDKNMNNPNEYRYIKEYAKQHHLKIFSVGYYHSWCRSINASPIELLGWVKHATMVVTDTFHGSVLSIICNTPVVVKVRGNQNKLRFLLSEYGLLERIMTDFDAFKEVADSKIDFEKVNCLIEEKRTKSMQFIDNSLKKCL